MFVAATRDLLACMFALVEVALQQAALGLWLQTCRTDIFVLEDSKVQLALGTDGGVLGEQ
jgi:hypothetical protein